ncbi:MAG: hypothetical protein ACI4Q4_06335 [Oscillospiraceae bacterium]
MEKEKSEFNGGKTMTIEEIFCKLYEKYGENFNWSMVPLTQARGFYVSELQKELGCDTIFQNKVYAVAKCNSNDYVLYLIADDSVEGLWRIYHLTYSCDTIDGVPHYEEFASRQDVGFYIEKKYIDEYL